MKTILFYFTLIFMFFSGLLTFCLNRKHLLLMLISLEMVVLSLYMYLFFYLSFFCNEYFFCLVYLTFSVCKGVLGLSILVSLIRSHGNDYFKSFSILW